MKRLPIPPDRFGYDDVNDYAERLRRRGWIRSPADDLPAQIAQGKIRRTDADANPTENQTWPWPGSGIG